MKHATHGVAMLEIAATLRTWAAEGRRIAVATLVAVDGSAPRPVGAALAVEFGVALCSLATRAGFAVTVVDRRASFATKERFPEAVTVVNEAPGPWIADRRWGPEDTSTIIAALRGGVGYVGAMGSRATHARRVAGLKAHGVTPSELSRLNSPIGLDLGGSTPEHTAVAILAEIVAVQHGASAMPLSGTSGPLHR